MAQNKEGTWHHSKLPTVLFFCEYVNMNDVTIHFGWRTPTFEPPSGKYLVGTFISSHFSWRYRLEELRTCLWLHLTSPSKGSTCTSVSAEYVIWENNLNTLPHYMWWWIDGKPLVVLLELDATRWLHHFGQQQTSIGIVTHQGWACVRQGGFLRGFYVVALHIFTLHLWEMVQSTRICIYVTMSLCRQIPTFHAFEMIVGSHWVLEQPNSKDCGNIEMKIQPDFREIVFSPKKTPMSLLFFGWWRLRLGLEEVKTQGAPRDFWGVFVASHPALFIRSFLSCFPEGKKWLRPVMFDWYLVYLEITNSEIQWILCWWLLGSEKKSSWDRYCSLSPKQENLAGACPRISL